jgi:hypothetical protein
MDNLYLCFNPKFDNDLFNDLNEDYRENDNSEFDSTEEIPVEFDY